MIRKSGDRFSLATNAETRLRGDHAQIKKIEGGDVSKKYHPALAVSERGPASDLLQGESGRVEKARQYKKVEPGSHAEPKGLQEMRE
jgi:hypothetical protein